MKKIIVIFPINNPGILNQQHLDAYKSEDVDLILKYPKTHLDQLKTPEDVAEVMPLVEDVIVEAINEKPDVIIMSAFGDLCIDESNEFEEIPKVSTGRIVIRALEEITQSKFTILPSHLDNLVFIEPFIKQEQCHNYMTAPVATGLEPKDYTTREDALEHLVQAAKAAIEGCGVDALSVGCAGFLNIGAQLQQALKDRYGYDVKVLEPLDTALQYYIYKLSHEDG